MNTTDEQEGKVIAPIHILLLGDSGVGKTSFCHAYSGNKVSDVYSPSVGLDTIHKDHLLPGTGGIHCPVVFMDCGGDALENRFLINAAFDADVIILMYDITHAGTFEKLTLYLKKLHSFFGAKNEGSRDYRLPYLALVGTDQDTFRAVSQDAHNDFFIQGRFQSQNLISNFKSELIRKWVLTMISDVTGIAIDQKFVDANLGKAKANQKPQLTNLATEMKAFRNMNQQGQGNNCLIQ